MGSRTAGWVVVAVAALGGDARADKLKNANLLVGPVFGIRLGGPAGSTRAILGLEGGGGLGAQRLNLGVSRRLDRTFGYIELDPWYLVGASVGIGVDTDGAVQPVLGVWEGLPMGRPPCNSDDFASIGSLAFGYRYTGVHELYVTVKIGGIKNASYVSCD